MHVMTRKAAGTLLGAQKSTAQGGGAKPRAARTPHSQRDAQARFHAAAAPEAAHAATAAPGGARGSTRADARTDGRMDAHIDAHMDANTGHSRCTACGRGPGRVRGRAFAERPAVPPGASMAYNAPQAHSVAPQAHSVAPRAQNVAPQADRVAPQAHCLVPQAHGAAPQADVAAPQFHEAAPQADAAAPQFHGAPPQADAPVPPEGGAASAAAEPAPRAHGADSQSRGAVPGAHEMAPPAWDETHALPAAGTAACIAPNRRAPAGAPNAPQGAASPASAALARAVALCGGQSALASAIGVTQSHVWNWLARMRTPAEHCPAIERATRRAVRCEELRPDIDWGYLREVVREQAAAQCTAQEGQPAAQPRPAPLP